MDKILLTKNEITAKEIKDALNIAISQVEKNLVEYTDFFKYSNSENGFYEKSENIEWTTGFWTGEIWLAYEMTNNDKFKNSAIKHTKSFRERLDAHVDIDHHDMGFLYSLSCVSSYKLTGDKKARETAILASDHLLTRFIENGGYFQAWGEVGAENNTRLIIDCLLNMPLLFWASEETGDDKYKEKALIHIKTALKNIIRDDNSTYHTYFFNKDGQPTHGATVQGYKDGSAWARGQAWGVYGTALAYKYVKDPEYIETFEKITDFFIGNLPENLIPYWDFTFKDGSDEPRDSSSSAIAICGMLEMSKYLPKDKAEYYTKIAKKMLKALVDTCSISDYSKSNGQITLGTYARSSEFNPCNNRGLNECNTWGDYYYMEALVRLSKDWNLYW